MSRRIPLALAMIAALGLLGWQATRAAKPKDEMLELYGLFVDAVEKVEANYVRPVSRRELLESALEGMLQQLDPHSTYFSVNDAPGFRRQIEGEFGGIGIQVDVDPETLRLRVVAPMVGTPAYDAGMLAGDQILEIDGQSAEGMSPDKAVEVLTGRPGTDVKLSVLHEGSEEPETITITRAIIKVPSILGDHRKPDDSWDFLIDKDRKIGYVRISSFIASSAEDLRKVLDQLQEQGMRGLILDLRNDPGGLLSAAVEVADLFLADGEIVSTRGRNTQPRTFRAQKDSPFEDVPMVVLVNQNSASASEIVSAALQDHHRATIVGMRSYGKGSVQNLFELDSGNSVLKLTVASYYRPSGENIHRFRNAKPTDQWGVKPDKDCEVKLTPREYVDWFRARRDRDLASGHRRTPAETPKVEAEKTESKKDASLVEKKAEEKPKSEPQKKEAEKPQPKAGARRRPSGPMVDKQLEKALDVLRGKLLAKEKAA